jgi:hypothetical protein
MAFRAGCLFLILVSFCSFANPNRISEIQDRIRSKTCEFFLEGNRPMPALGNEPKVPSFLSVMGDAISFSSLESFRTYRAALASKRKFANTNKQYRRYRKNFESQLNRIHYEREIIFDIFNSEPMDSTLVGVVQELRTKGDYLLSSASTIEQLTKIETYLRQEATLILEISKKLKQARSKAQDILLNLQRTAAQTPLSDQVDNIVKTNMNLIWEVAHSEDEIFSFVSEAEEQIQPLLNLHYAQEVIRKSVELRFDLDEKNNSVAILNALINLNLPSAPELDVEKTAGKMETQPSLKTFVYSELQLLRRLLKKAEDTSGEARSILREGALTRYQNTVQSLAKLDQKGDVVGVLQSLRKSILILSHPFIFQGLIRSKALKTTTLLEREKIVRDALAIDEIKVMILNAALDLTTSLPMPIRPEEPSRTPPSQPQKPQWRINNEWYAYQVNSRIADYKAQWAVFKKRWEDYEKEFENYRDVEIPKYRQKIADLKSAFERRNKARLSYLVYLSHRQPEVFASISVSEAIRHQSEQAAVNRLNKPEGARLNERFRSLASTTSRWSAIRSSGPDLSGWMLYYYTQNPMWLFSRDLAIWTLVGSDSSFSVAQPQLGQLLGIDKAPELSEQTLSDINSTQQALLDLEPFRVPPNTPSYPENYYSKAVAAFELADEMRAGNNDIPNLPDQSLSELSSLEEPTLAMPEIQIPEFPNLDLWDKTPDLQIPDIQLHDVAMDASSISNDFVGPDSDVSGEN